jgi:hypothetical protein
VVPSEAQTPDGMTLASRSEDGKFKRWDVGPGDVNAASSAAPTRLPVQGNGAKGNERRPDRANDARVTCRLGPTRSPCEELHLDVQAPLLDSPE